MALRNAETFENMNETVTETKTEVKTPAPEVRSSVTGTAVASAAKAVVAVANTQAKPGQFKEALLGYQGSLDMTDMFGVYPKIIVNLGGFKIEGILPEGVKEKMGPEITITLVSWNHRWIASPGSDDAEAKKFVKYSNDGLTVAEDGSLLADYVLNLKDVEGFKNASIKNYVSIWGFLSAVGDQVFDPANQTMVELQCSPQTAAQFKGHRQQHGMKVSSGVCLESNVLKCHAQSRSLNGKDFGLATFTAG